MKFLSKINPSGLVKLLFLCLILLFLIMPKAKAQINVQPITGVVGIENAADAAQGIEKHYWRVGSNYYLVKQTNKDGYELTEGDIIDDLFKRVEVLEQFISNMTASKEVLIFASGSQDDTKNIEAYKCKIGKSATGIYEVAFENKHPNGDAYGVQFGQEEDGDLRDVPKVSVVEGSRSSTGFKVQVTVDDNGTGADIPIDDIWSFSITYMKAVYVQE